MAADALALGVKAVAKPVARLVKSADNEKKFNRVATEQTTDVFAVRTSAHVPLTAKNVVDAGKVAVKAVAAKPAPAPVAPGGFWGKFGTGLGILDIGAGLWQTMTGISELRVGKKRDGWVNVTGGAAFIASSALYLAGAAVLGPVAATAACVIPGVNELVYGLQQKDRKKQLSGGALVAGGLGFATMGVMAATGAGAAATVLGLPVMTALAVGTSALLIGRAVIGGWGPIKDLAGRVGKRLGLG
jgi:hypothetical protein